MPHGVGRLLVLLGNPGSPGETIRPATPADWPAICDLLTEAGLPLHGAREALPGFLLAVRGSGELVGCAALERYGDCALLRSVAVTANARGEGWGERLTRRILADAQANGIHEIWLLTTTAPDYFRRFGFRPAQREDAPAALQGSIEFREACPASAIALRLDLTLFSRPATPDDADAICRIYNQGIAERIATFETRPRRSEEIRAWFDAPYPIVVVTDGRDGPVIAFASGSSYRPRECYAGIAEFSVYVDSAHRGRGAGHHALAALMDAAEAAGFWKLVSRIFVENAASRALCRSLGFREVGVYEKHGRLAGGWRDVVIVERLLPGGLARQSAMEDA